MCTPPPPPLPVEYRTRHAFHILNWAKSQILFSVFTTIQCKLNRPNLPSVKRYGIPITRTNPSHFAPLKHKMFDRRNWGEMVLGRNLNSRSIHGRINTSWPSRVTEYVTLKPITTSCPGPIIFGHALLSNLVLSRCRHFCDVAALDDVYEDRVVMYSREREWTPQVCACGGGICVCLWTEWQSYVRKKTGTDFSFFAATTGVRLKPW